jgi:hypothetical protein
MARKHRTGAVLDTVQQRLAGLKSITSAPNFGTSLRHTDADTVMRWGCYFFSVATDAGQRGIRITHAD